MRTFLVFALTFCTLIFVGCGSADTRDTGRRRSSRSSSDASTISTQSDTGASTSTPSDAGLLSESDAMVSLDAGSGSADASVNPSDAGVCNPPLIRCGQDCIDPNTDDLNCGSCGNACDQAQFESCEMGTCVASTDCRITGCTGFTYCDSSTNLCEPGCDRNDQCGMNEVCDVPTHACQCEPGFHDCNSICVSNTDPATCGNSCTPCATDPNGSAACDGVSCSLTCNIGFLECQGACAQCPTGNNVISLGCNGATCVATSCDNGFIPCADGCCIFRSVRILDGPSGSTAGESDITMDGTTMHVSFGHRNPSTDSLRRASRDLANPSGWTQTYLGFGGIYSRIAVFNGFPRVAHFNHELDFVSIWQAGSECAVAERGVNPGGPVAFDIDNLGRNHIIYKTGTTFRTMRYEYGFGCGGPNWPNISLGFGTANRIDLVTGSDNLARTAKAGQFMTRTASDTWDFETIHPNVTGVNISIALDAFDNPHISYYDTVNDDLWYAYRIGSTWTNILVADTGDVGEVNEIAIDNQGRVHIVYRDETPGAQKLMYAYYDLNQWHYSTVVIGFSTGLSPSIAVDYRGAPHIVYSEGRTVKHAYLD